MGKKFRYKLLELLVDKKFYDETWHYYLTGERSDSFPNELRHSRTYMIFGHKFYSLLPNDPHCHECGIPMAGIGGSALRFMGSAPSKSLKGKRHDDKSRS